MEKENLIKYKLVHADKNRDGELFCKNGNLISTMAITAENFEEIVDFAEKYKESVKLDEIYIALTVETIKKLNKER